MRETVRTLRSNVWRVARRWGVVPSGQSDRVGEDDALIGATLRHRVMVFFADPPGSLYQLRQWYETFRAVDRELGLVVVLQDSRTARIVRAESGLDAIVVAEPSTIDDLLSRSSVALVLYVNHNPANFTNLRLTELVHVSLMHGDSDKGVSASNQLKAYDYAFVAGQAAVDRIGGALGGYDAERRCLPVGRPQVGDHLARVTGRPAPTAEGDGRLTVLYAPTWEGPSRAAAYGSIVTHGRALVASILADPDMTLVYRPHPLSGVRSREYAEADAELRALVKAAGAPHRTDVGVEVEASFADADVLVSDVSAVAVDWLAWERPLVITDPADPLARSTPDGLRARVPGLGAGAAQDAAEFIRDAVSQRGSDAERRALAGYYLGDTTPGAAQRQFLEACRTVIEHRAAERASDSMSRSAPALSVESTNSKEGL